jgi:hypothetical protein
MWVNKHDHDHLSKSDFARIAESMRESGEALVPTLGISPI